MLHKVWQDRVKDVVQNKLETNVLAAFNTNVDVVVHLTNSCLEVVEADPQVNVEESKTLIKDRYWYYHQ